VVLKKSKSNLLRKDDISLLGFTVTKEKLRPAEKQMDQIQLSLEKLRTQKDLRALLASLNFYRMFYPQFSFYAVFV
jgi:thymidylate synthase